MGLTFGQTDASDSNSFFHNLGAADTLHHGWALLAGTFFNLANILVVAAISVFLRQDPGIGDKDET